MLSFQRSANTWQLILADLALILFLVAAAALTARSTSEEEDQPNTEASQGKTPETDLAPSQALYRAGSGLPTLAEWLERQPRDPRAALTIVAQHAPGDEEIAWAEARRMAATASALGVRSRVVIRAGAANDIHASLAYDQPGI